MRKRRKGRKLGYARDARKALLRGLVRALVLHEAIETSRPRAKQLRGFIDRLVTTTKKGTIAAKRQVVTSLGGDKETATRLFKKLPAFKERKSGFTRLIPLSERRGDGSLRTRVEWTDKEKKVERVEKALKRNEKTRNKNEKRQFKIQNS